MSAAGAGYGGADILADHSILLAIPAFLPAFAVVGVVVFIAVRDRRAGDDDSEPSEEDQT